MEKLRRDVAFLCRIKKASNNKIFCAVATKIIEDELVVGVLTETNQFIQLFNLRCQ